MSDTSISVTNDICKTIEKMEGQFKLALPPHIPPERFARIAVTAVRNEPKLSECDRTSLLSSLMLCAQDGLLPDKREAAIIPWGKTARYMPMVGGILKKARNSGEIKTINAIVVHEKDQFESWVDETGEHFKHKKSFGDRGKPVMTYAYAITKDGGFYFEEITEDEMQKIKAMSKANDSPWKGPFENEMRRKSAIRRLAKYRLPSSTDLDGIIRSEDDLYDMDQEKERAEAKPTSSRLSRVISSEEKKEEPVMTTATEEQASRNELNDEDIPI